jgi:hypothetical protein
MLQVFQRPICCVCHLRLQINTGAQKYYFSLACPCVFMGRISSFTCKIKKSHSHSTFMVKKSHTQTLYCFCAIKCTAPLADYCWRPLKPCSVGLALSDVRFDLRLAERDLQQGLETCSRDLRLDLRLAYNDLGLDLRLGGKDLKLDLILAHSDLRLA